MRPALHAALAFVVAFILAWTGAIIVYSFGSSVGWWHDRDGGIAMGFFLTVGPVAGTLTGIVAAIWAFLRARRHNPVKTVDPAPPRPAWPWPIRALAAASVFGAAAYLIGILVFWIFMPYSGSSYDRVGQFHWHAPSVMGIIGALIGGLKAARPRG